MKTTIEINDLASNVMQGIKRTKRRCSLSVRSECLDVLTLHTIQPLVKFWTFRQRHLQKLTWGSAGQGVRPLSAIKILRLDIKPLNPVCAKQTH